MARITYVAKAQQRYETVPDLDEQGNQKTQVVYVKGKPQTRRLTVEDRSKPLDPFTCESCHKPIEVGTPYKWVKPVAYRGARGRKRTRHQSCPNWRPSELTSSPALGTLYGAQETAEAELAAWNAEDGLEAARSIIEALAEGVREAAAVYEESADNMESGFGTSTSISDEIREKGETLASQADEVENADLPEDWDEDTVRAEVVEEAAIEGLDDPSSYDWDEDPEDLEDNYQTRLQEWGDEVRNAVEEAFQMVEGV